SFDGIPASINSVIPSPSLEVMERLSRARGEIETLRTRLAAEERESQGQAVQLASLNEELAVLQQRYVSDLAARDRDYARQIALYRQTVTDVSATPEGLEALERFNNGDWEGARAILTRLTETLDRVENLQRAARYRSVAMLYREARSRGQETVENVIAQFERVVALDDTNFNDWIALSRAYYENGDTAGMRRASERALAAATDDSERGRAMIDAAYAASQQGDQARALQMAEEGLTLAREQVERTPEDVNALDDLAYQLRFASNHHQLAGEIDVALAQNRESLALWRRLLAGQPESTRYRDGIALALISIAEMLGQRGEFADANAALHEALATYDAMMALEPARQEHRRGRLVALYQLGRLEALQNRPATARAHYQAMFDEFARLSELDPTSAMHRRDRASSRFLIAETWIAENNREQAEALFLESLADFRALAASDPTSWTRRRDISETLVMLADAALARDATDEARAHYAEAETLIRANLAANPSSADARNDLAGLLPKLRDFAARTGDMARASALETEIAALPAAG
ncbi:MAG: hypothetical protein H7X93_10645, partial [Sphingomonadaceae bacterium]|nr:hypothetical protein [Sphingomonadaceae bacterium]